MFESIIGQALEKFLGKYVEGLDRKNLKIGLWSGEFKLQNLQLKQDILGELNFPVSLSASYIGEFYIKIPWTYIFSQPLVVYLRNIHLCCSRIPEQTKNDESLKNKEKIEEIYYDDEEEDDEDIEQSITQRLVQKIIQTLELDITNVSIRYEDDLTNSEKPFAIGATLQHVRIKSAGTTNNPLLIRKLLEVGNLGLYWNWEKPAFKGSNSLEKTQRKFEKIQKSEKNYILKPVTCVLKLRINKKLKRQQRENKTILPKYDLNFQCQDIKINFEQQQYEHLITLINSFPSNSESQEDEENVQEEKKIGEIKGFKISATLPLLGLTLWGKNEEKMSRFTIENSGIIFSKIPNKGSKNMKLKGILGSFNVFHLTPPFPVQIFGIEGENLADFYYASFVQKIVTSNGFYDSILKIRLNSVHFTYLQEFLDEFLDFFKTNQKEENQKIQKKAEKQIKKIQKKNNENYLRWELVVKNPQLIFPKGYHDSSVIIGDLGNISIISRYCYENNFNFKNKTKIKKMEISIENMALRSSKILGDTDCYQNIVQNLNFLYQSISPISKGIYPESKQFLEISKIDIKLNEFQYNLFNQIWNENFYYKNYIISNIKSNLNQKIQNNNFNTNNLKNSPKIKRKNSTEISSPINERNKTFNSWRKKPKGFLMSQIFVQFSEISVQLFLGYILFPLDLVYDQI